jgi:oxygen-dependent protoporphyrinogen oxidase
MPSSTHRRRIAVVGGGIAGLAAAHRLGEIAPQAEVTLFEASGRLGGVLRTEAVDGYLLEHSADSFITSNPAAVELCRRIGFDELIPTNDRLPGESQPHPRLRSAFVVRRGRLVRVPEGFMLLQPRRLWPLMTSPLLSPLGKLRLLAECLVPRRRDAGDERLAAFARRRLGRETYERLVQPLVGGIYTADAEKLSLAATLPRFIELERKHGSLVRAALRERQSTNGASAARYGLFVAPRQGMGSLVAALAARLPAGCVRLSAGVESLTRSSDGRWQVIASSTSTSAAPANAITPDDVYDAVILALPAQRIAAVLTEVDGSLAAALAEIEYADSALALVGVRRDAVRHPLDGFGFVAPEIENRQILACSFSSVKFPGRAPVGSLLLRVFVGGARRPEQVDLPDDELRRIVLAELGELIGLSGEPELFRVVRWRGAMAQYHLGHLQKVERIEARIAELPGLELAGNALRGVGVPDCVRGGEQAAEKCSSFLADRD